MVAERLLELINEIYVEGIQLQKIVLKEDLYLDLSSYLVKRFNIQEQLSIERFLLNIGNGLIIENGGK